MPFDLERGEQLVAAAESGDSAKITTAVEGVVAGSTIHPDHWKSAIVATNTGPNANWRTTKAVLEADSGNAIPLDALIDTLPYAALHDHAAVVFLQNRIEQYTRRRTLMQEELKNLRLAGGIAYMMLFARREIGWVTGGNNELTCATLIWAIRHMRDPEVTTKIIHRHNDLYGTPLSNNDLCSVISTQRLPNLEEHFPALLSCSNLEGKSALIQYSMDKGLLTVEQLSKLLAPVNHDKAHFLTSLIENNVVGAARAGVLMTPWTKTQRLGVFRQFPEDAHPTIQLFFDITTKRREGDRTLTDDDIYNMKVALYIHPKLATVAECMPFLPGNPGLVCALLDRGYLKPDVLAQHVKGWAEADRNELMLELTRDEFDAAIKAIRKAVAPPSVVNIVLNALPPVGGAGLSPRSLAERVSGQAPGVLPPTQVRRGGRSG